MWVRGLVNREAGACRPPLQQDLYCSLDHKALLARATVTTHRVVGTVAGILEHCVMYPIDCIMVRLGLALNATWG